MERIFTEPDPAKAGSRLDGRGSREEPDRALVAGEHLLDQLSDRYLGGRLALHRRPVDRRDRSLELFGGSLEHGPRVGPCAQCAHREATDVPPLLLTQNDRVGRSGVWTGCAVS